MTDGIPMERRVHERSDEVGPRELRIAVFFRAEIAGVEQEVSFLVESMEEAYDPALDREAQATFRKAANALRKGW